jgi:hypothetical protein
MNQKNCLDCMCRTWSCVCNDVNNNKVDNRTHPDFRYKPIGVGIMPSRKHNDYIKIIYKQKMENKSNKSNKKHVFFSSTVEMVFIPHFTECNERWY